MKTWQTQTEQTVSDNISPHGRNKRLPGVTRFPIVLHIITGKVDPYQVKDKEDRTNILFWYSWYIILYLHADLSHTMHTIDMLYHAYIEVLAKYTFSKLSDHLYGSLYLCYKFHWHSIHPQTNWTLHKTKSSLFYWTI